MDKKRELVRYLLEILGDMERGRNRRMTYTDFADLVGLPLKTVVTLFDAEDSRLPKVTTARTVAIGLGSNRILEILGYEKIDPVYLRFQVALKDLKPEQQRAILRQMEQVAEKNYPEGERTTIAA